MFDVLNDVILSKNHTLVTISCNLGIPRPASNVFKNTRKRGSGEAVTVVIYTLISLIWKTPRWLGHLDSFGALRLKGNCPPLDSMAISTWASGILRKWIDCTRKQKYHEKSAPYETNANLLSKRRWNLTSSLGMFMPPSLWCCHHNAKSLFSFPPQMQG